MTNFRNFIFKVETSLAKMVIKPILETKNAPEENASKFRAFLLKWGIKTLKKKYRRFWMQSAPQLTQIWLRTVIVYPLKAPQKKLF